MRGRRLANSTSSLLVRRPHLRVTPPSLTFKNLLRNSSHLWTPGHRQPMPHRHPRVSRGRHSRDASRRAANVAAGDSVRVLHRRCSRTRDGAQRACRVPRLLLPRQFE